MAQRSIPCRIACVLVVLALQLAGSAHLARVRHATCVEHGESVEIADAARTDVAQLSIATAHHQHCGLSACVRHSGRRPAPVLHRSTAARVRLSRGIADRSSPIPLLLLAPKASPPLV